MYLTIIKALVDTNGTDISGKNVEMPAGSYHIISKRDIKHFQAHPAVFEISRDAADDVPVMLHPDVYGNRALEGADGLGFIKNNDVTGHLERWDAATGAYVPVIGLVESPPGSGNYVANIIPRTGTLAALTAIKDTAGHGEIASVVNAAGAVVAMAQFSNPTGTAGTISIFQKSTLIGTLTTNFGGSTGIVTGSVAPLVNDITNAITFVDGQLTALTDGATASFINTTDAANHYIDLAVIAAAFGPLSKVIVKGNLVYTAGATFDGDMRGVTVARGISDVLFSAVKNFQQSFIASQNDAISVPFSFTHVEAQTYPLLRIQSLFQSTVAPSIPGSALASGQLTIEVYA